MNWIVFWRYVQLLHMAGFDEDQAKSLALLRMQFEQEPKRAHGVEPYRQAHPVDP